MEGDLENLLNGQQFKKIYEKSSFLITEKYGLHKIEIEIMLFLRDARYDTARDIVECKFFSKAHVSKAIESLMDRGYIVGKPDEQDRRCIHLILTKSAEPVCYELESLRRRLYEIIYDGISEEEKQTMRRIANRIAYNINEELTKQEKERPL